MSPTFPMLIAVPFLVGLLLWWQGWAVAILALAIAILSWATGVLHERYHSGFSMLAGAHRRKHKR